MAEDRHAAIRGVQVDLWRGPFRDDLRMWRDVRPALGGLIARRTVRRRDSDRLFDEAIDALRSYP